MFCASQTHQHQEVNGDRGVMPKGIDVELRGSLADRCAVGDVVTVVGIVQTVPEGRVVLMG